MRLSGYDYSSCGAYFVTVCVSDKMALIWNARADNIRPRLRTGATYRPTPVGATILSARYFLPNDYILICHIASAFIAFGLIERLVGAHY